MPQTSTSAIPTQGTQSSIVSTTQQAANLADERPGEGLRGTIPTGSGQTPSPEIAAGGIGSSANSIPPTTPRTSTSMPIGTMGAAGTNTPDPDVCREPSTQQLPAPRDRDDQTTGCENSNGADLQLVAASQPLSEGGNGTSASTSTVAIPAQGLQFPIVSTTQQVSGLSGGVPSGGSGGGGGGTSPIIATPIVINGGAITLLPIQTIGSFPGNQTNPGTGPLVQINDGTVNQNPSGTIVQFPTGSTVTIGGPALSLTNGTINAPGSTLVDVNGTVTSTSGPLIALTNSNTNVGTILDVGPNGQVTAAGPILHQTGGTTTINQGGILVHDNSQLTGNQLVNSTNGVITVNNGPLAGAANNSSITTTSTAPAIQTTGGSLTLGPGSSGLSITDHSHANLTGPIMGTN